MRWLALGCCAVLSGCWDFDQTFKDRCDAGELTGPACGTGGGGATGGGAAMGGGRGAAGGGTGGGTPCAFGRGAWCWENPAPVGNDLFAVWGTSDSDVWVAGAGYTLLSYDGSRYTDRSSLLPTPTDAGLWGDDPAITGVVVDDAGVWLIGENMGLLVSDGGPFTEVPMQALDRNWGAIASFGGVRYLLRPFSDQLMRLPGGPLSIAALGMPTRITALLVDADTCAAAVEGAVGSQLIDCRDGGVMIDATRLDGGPDRFHSVFRLGDGRLAAGGRHSNLFVRDGGAWSELPLDILSGTEEVRASSPTDAGLLVCGHAGFVVNADTNVSLREPNFASLNAAWTSPDTFWAAGSHGSLVRGAGGPGAENEPAIRGLWVDDTVQIAVGTIRIIVRQADGTWLPRTHAPQRGWTAVAVTGQTTWLIAEDGEVWRQTGTGEDLDWVGSLEQGTASYRDHANFALGLADGGVLLGSGGMLARFNEEDGGLRSLGADGGAIVSADGGRLTQIISITERGGIITVADPYSVYQSPDDGVTWFQRFVTTSSPIIEGLALCPDGTVAFGGGSGVLRRLHTDGGDVRLAPSSAASALVTFGGMWCAPDNTVWAITEGGFVSHFLRDGGVARETTGWGGRSSEPIDSTFIRANSTQLFITGSRGAILSRPVP